MVVTANIAGLLIIGRLTLLAVIDGLLSEKLGMCRAVAITAMLFLTTGFLAGIRSFVFH